MNQDFCQCRQTIIQILLICVLASFVTSQSNSRVKRQFGININGRQQQDLIGGVLGLFNNGNNNNRPNNNSTRNNIVDALNLFGNIVGGGNRPNTNHQNQGHQNQGHQGHNHQNHNSNQPGNQNGGNQPSRNDCGFQGSACEQGCRRTRRGIRCFCNDGFRLNNDRRTCTDRNECGRSNGGCFGICQNTPGSFQCSCEANLVLQSDGRTCSGEGGSSGGSSSGGSGRRTCNVQNGGCSQGCSENNFGVTCFCQSGFTLGQDQVTCNQLDLCLQNNGGCHQICTTTATAGVECSCNQGFVLQRDRRSCTSSQTNPTCSVNNGGCAHFCQNTRQGRQCFCGRGYELQADKVSCTLPKTFHSCSDSNGGCGQTCNQNFFGIQCSCQNGYQLQQDRKQCIDYDECTFNNGGCHQICTNNEGSRVCSCPSGATLQADGVRCASAQVASCAQQNGGCADTCNVFNNAITCSCRNGFTLGPDTKSCTDIDECQQNNGGCEQRCRNTQGSFKCTCKAGYSLVNGRCTKDSSSSGGGGTGGGGTGGGGTGGGGTGGGGQTAAQIGCGVNGKKSLFNRIVGGRPANPEDWPWMAALLMKTGNTQYCGGTLITDRHILTAAHCMKPFSSSEVKVRLGEYNFESFDDRNPKDFNVAEIRNHENYDENTQENDISLIRLEGTTEFSDFIWPICLPTAGKDYTGSRGYVTGWGTIHFGGPVSSVLQEIIVPVWSDSDCKAAYPGKVFDGMMCAGLKAGGKDSCQGDSGGPLQTQDPRTRRWEISGVVSWGIQCAKPDNPGVYTQVNNYLDWIRANALV